MPIGRLLKKLLTQPLQIYWCNKRYLPRLRRLSSMAVLSPHFKKSRQQSFTSPVKVIQAHIHVVVEPQGIKMQASA